MDLSGGIQITLSVAAIAGIGRILILVGRFLERIEEHGRRLDGLEKAVFGRTRGGRRIENES